MESAQRMMPIQVELDGRRIGGSALLIPYADTWYILPTVLQKMVFPTCQP